MKTEPIHHRAVLGALAAILALTACATAPRPGLARLAELWRAPGDLERRDLFNGHGGASNAPQPDAPFAFIEVKQSGVNPGYDVRDADSVRWSVKLGVEARTEIVVSRIVWAVGYHQPFVYYVPRWTLVRDGKETVFEGARFRREPKSHDKRGEWAWRDNPFLGTRELAGLYVLMVLFNNWDLKPAQNALYEVRENGGEPETWYMVRDLGASLGRSAWFTFGTKDDPSGFEREKFITSVDGNRVRFAFQGGWLEPHIQRSVRPSDVRWICGLLARLSDEQWTDAFRAGGYTSAEAAPFIERLKTKIAEGVHAGIR